MAVTDVRIEDHSEEVLKVFQEAVEAALTAIGLAAEGHAKEICPVDTGRLRNSITNVVDADDKSVIIGTNVEYGPAVELGTERRSPKPFLRPAAQNYGAEYKQLFEQALKNANP